jgi:hypothetical protein
VYDLVLRRMKKKDKHVCRNLHGVKKFFKKIRKMDLSLRWYVSTKYFICYKVGVT